MPHDVFISYAHADKLTADAVCNRLESAGIRCWIAPRDIIPGKAWNRAIVDGVKSCRLMVLVFSEHADKSEHVEREVAHAFEKGLTVVPFRVADVKPQGGLEYFLGTVHWLDALSLPLERHLDRLVHYLKVSLAAGPPTADLTAASPSATGVNYVTLTQTGQTGTEPPAPRGTPNAPPGTVGPFQAKAEPTEPTERTEPSGTTAGPHPAENGVPAQKQVQLSGDQRSKPGTEPGRDALQPGRRVPSARRRSPWLPVTVIAVIVFGGLSLYFSRQTNPVSTGGNPGSSPAIRSPATPTPSNSGPSPTMGQTAATPKQANLRTGPGDSDRPAPEKKVNRDALKDLQ